MAQNYDVIVVGAGPGGSSAAKNAAKLGLKTLLLERAQVPGQKNMSGSTLFRKPTEDVGFKNWAQADWSKHMPRMRKGYAASKNTN